MTGCITLHCIVLGSGRYTRPPSKGGFAWMARALKKVFKLNKSIEKRQWEAHYDMELKRRQDAQADRQRRRDAGENVPEVQESSITPVSLGSRFRIVVV